MVFFGQVPTGATGLNRSRPSPEFDTYLDLSQTGSDQLSSRPADGSTIPAHRNSRSRSWDRLLSIWGQG
jgi:hypothetical protein